MRYCINCGKELMEDARFCAYCGTAVNGDTAEKRRMVYEGDIHKCPNCGEVVEAFTTNCPICGFEFRNTQATNAVKELAQKLEKIENSRTSKQSGWLSCLDNAYRINETDQKKISLIQNFAIPNAKEDLFEFMVLASSNINLQRYANSATLSASERAVSDAWHSKFEQSYKKAKLCINDTYEFEKIKNIFTEKQKEIRRAKRHQYSIPIMIIGLPIALICILVVWLESSECTDAIQKENDRLNILASEVYEAIEAKNFDIAKAKTANLVYTGPNTTSGKQSAKKWENTRNELATIIENAEKAYKSNGGTTLPTHINSPSINADDDIDQSKEFNQVPDDFCNGYSKATFSDYNSPLEENSLGGSRIYLTGTLKEVEIFNADGFNCIAGHFTDDEDNVWVLLLNAIPLVEKTHYDVAVGERICCTGVYNGYFEEPKIPMVVVNEIFVFKDGMRLNGMQKILDTE